MVATALGDGLTDGGGTECTAMFFFFGVFSYRKKCQCSLFYTCCRMQCVIILVFTSVLCEQRTLKGQYGQWMKQSSKNGGHKRSVGTSAMFELLSPARIVLPSVYRRGCQAASDQRTGFRVVSVKGNERAFHPSCLVYPPVPLPLLAGLCYITCQQLLGGDAY